MKLYRHAISALCCALTIAGCSAPLQTNQVKVTYQTIPPGAMIYKGQQALGRAPQSLTYTFDQQALTAGYYIDREVTAVWPSGARVGTFKILTSVKDGEIQISRPVNAPGLDVDLANADRLRSIESAESDRAANAFLEGYMINKALQPPVVITPGARPVAPTQINCSTVSNGGPGVVNPTYQTRCQ